ncbi:DoxX family protein [Massilia sp. CF038]|uniref:DoxX family protein n=1 Tax=Massilia sp. CF038 TaxID=1881045 RepID=UPI000923D559|nr:DoxX family protein [Massilia sp. CF038]SHG51921.1 putative oxidoreductase [Massilia sp. CF038]
MVSLKSNGDSGKLILRAALAIMILFHGVAKIIGGAGFITGLVAKAGLPPALGYLVYVGEVVAPLLVLFGVWTRAAAAVIAINMLVAIFLVHMPQLFKISGNGGYALELQVMFLAAALSVAMLGAGKFSVGGSSGKMN